MKRPGKLGEGIAIGLASMVGFLLVQPTASAGEDVLCGDATSLDWMCQTGEGSGEPKCTIIADFGCAWMSGHLPTDLPVFIDDGKVIVYLVPNPDMSGRFWSIWFDSSRLPDVVHVHILLEQFCPSGGCVTAPFQAFEGMIPGSPITASLYMEDNVVHLELDRA